MATRDALHRSALDLIRSVLPPERGVRLVGVTVSNFVEVRTVAPDGLPIFADAAA